MTSEWVVATRDTLDQGRAYQAYCLLGGDAGKTAVMCHTSPEVIESLAHDFQWGRNVRTDVSNPEKLKAFKEQNRMAQYMVAERARDIVSGLVNKMASNPQFLERMVVKVDPESGDASVEPKAIESLIKSLNTIGDISYRALGDAEAVEAGKNSAAAVAVNALDLYARMQARFDTKSHALIATAESIKNAPQVVIDVG
jgi:hypothetical protein